MAFPSHWWILGIVLVLALYSLGHYLCYLEKFSQVGLYEIDRMTRKDFQHFSGILLKKMGYRVLRPKREKQWVNLILEKNEMRIAVSVKQYRGPVNTRPVERIAEGAIKNHCEHAVVLTNRDYSTEAMEKAEELEVELWDRDRLADMLIAYRR